MFGRVLTCFAARFLAWPFFMLISFIFSYSENFFVVLSFNFIPNSGASARDSVILLSFHPFMCLCIAERIKKLKYTKFVKHQTKCRGSTNFRSLLTSLSPGRLI